MRFFWILFATGCAVFPAVADSTTYIGDQFPYLVTGIATDTKGNTYVTGSRTIPISSPSVVPATATDIFVSKVDAAGNSTLLATISGKGNDQANGIAIDPAGNIYLVGRSTSLDFPLYHPLQTINNGCFLVKLAPDGSVIYSTYLGGTRGFTSLNAVAADAQGNAYVTGETFAADYPHTAGLPAGMVGGPGPGSVTAAFFAKISPAGDKLLYAGGIAATSRTCGCCSSCFLSTLSTAGVSIALDSAGNAYIAGNTNGTGLPATSGAFLTNGSGAFVAKVNAAGNGLVYLTYLGALPLITAPGVAAPTLAHALAVDTAGNAYVSGQTIDPNFPATAGAFQTKLAIPASGAGGLPPADGFAAKLNPTGSVLVWASFLGGTQFDSAQTIALDSAGDAWVSGVTQSTDFPVSVGFPSGGEFVAEFNPAGSALLYGSRFPSDTVAVALAVDASGTVHAAGDTGLISTILPAQAGLPQLFGVANAAGGQLAGRVAPGELISLYGLYLGLPAPVSAAFDSSGFLPTTLGGIEMTINGTPVPLLYVSDTQINAVAPVELVSGASVSLLLANHVGMPVASHTLTLPLMVDAVIPGVFLSDGTSAAAAINQDGTVNSESNPAKPGSYVSIWATGVGGTPGLLDGQMITAALNPGCCVLYDMSNGQTIVPSYAGAAPGLVNGMTQINFQANNGGDFYLVSGGKVSSPFSVFVGE